MSTSICIFEDDRCTQFLPLTYFRPVYDLRCGITTLREKIARAYPKAKIGLHCREYLSDTLRKSNPDAAVNEIQTESCLFINGRVLADNSFSKKIPLNQKSDVVYVHGDHVVAAHLSGANLGKVRGR